MKKSFKIVLFSLILFSPFSLSFGQVELLGDPHNNISTLYGSPRDFAEMGGYLYFFANSGTGVDLWKTDGTQGGTSVVERNDYANFGLNGGLVADPVNQVLYYEVFTCHTGFTLAKSDGVAGNQTLLKLDSTVENPDFLYLWNQNVYFSNPAGFWVSDGSPAGTKHLFDIGPDKEFREIITYASVGGLMIIAVKDSNNYTGLWATDGTIGNTYPVFDFMTKGWTGSLLGNYQFQGALYFFISNNGTYELWKTQGTDSTTVFIGTVGNYLFSLKMLTLNNELFFLIKEGGSGDSVSLKKTNGLPGSIETVKKVGMGYDGGFEIFQDKLLFVVDNLGFNMEFWQSDGTNAGTQLFQTINPTFPFDGIAVHDSLLFYRVQNSLWRTDGTTAGTYIIGDKFDIATFNGNYASFQGKMYFQGVRDDTLPNNTFPGAELYVTDGSSAGTDLFMDLYTYPSMGDIDYYASINGKHLYLADTDSLDPALWVSDGTPGGTHLLKDISQGKRFSISNAVLWQNDLYFITEVSNRMFTIWKSDGTESGTNMVFFEEDGGLGGKDIAVYDDELYFHADLDDLNSTNYRTELWKLSDPAASPQLVKDIAPGNSSSDAYNFREVNGMLTFIANNSDYGNELWVTDGTESGTQILRDIKAGSQDGIWDYFFESGVAGDQLFFVASEDTHFIELWVTDGTPAGTRLVKDINPSPVFGSYGSSDPLGLTPFGDKMAFFARDGSLGFELWISDGTEAGTQMVKDIYPGNRSAIDAVRFEGMVALDSLLIFQANDGLHGKELWRSDGTGIGTFMLKDILPGSLCSSPKAFYKHEDFVYFVIEGEDLKPQIWQTDGTAAGTQMINGFPTENPFALIEQLVKKDSLVLFVGYHEDYGRALFRIDPEGNVDKVEDEFSELTIQLFPNPAKDMVHIRLSEGIKGEIQMNIISLQGQIISTQNHRLGNLKNEFQIDVSTLAAGLYFLQVAFEGEVYSKKFLVE